MDEELPICDVSAYFEKDGLSLKDIFPDLFGQPENLQQHPPTAGDSPPRVDEFGDSSNQNRISEENEHGEEEEEEEDDVSQILINEKLRVLQELVPNCNKTDQALVLDDVIEYLAAIKLQVEVMYARMGRFPFPPMMPEIGMGNPMFPLPAASDDQPLLPLAAGVNPISGPEVLPTPAPNPQLQMPLLPSQQYSGTSIARPIYITDSPLTLDHLNEVESSSQNLRSISNISQHGSMISQREIVPATRVVSPSNINMMENVVAEDPQLGKEAGNEDPG